MTSSCRCTRGPVRGHRDGQGVARRLDQRPRTPLSRRRKSSTARRVSEPSAQGLSSKRRVPTTNATVFPTRPARRGQDAGRVPPGGALRPPSTVVAEGDDDATVDPQVLDRPADRERRRRRRASNPETTLDIRRTGMWRPRCPRRSSRRRPRRDGKRRRPPTRGSPSGIHRGSMRSAPEPLGGGPASSRAAAPPRHERGAEGGVVHADAVVRAHARAPPSAVLQQHAAARTSAASFSAGTERRSPE